MTTGGALVEHSTYIRCTHTRPALTKEVREIEIWQGSCFYFFLNTNLLFFAVLRLNLRLSCFKSTHVLTTTRTLKDSSTLGQGLQQSYFLQCSCNVREMRCWEETKATLLFFFCVIRLSADKPGIWCGWGLRGCDIGFVYAPGAAHSWDYQGRLEVLILKLPTSPLVSKYLCETHCLSHKTDTPAVHVTPTILEVNGRSSGWPGGWTEGSKTRKISVVRLHFYMSQMSKSK